MKLIASSLLASALLVAPTLASAQDYQTQDEKDGYSVLFDADKLGGDGLEAAGPLIKAGFRPVRFLLLRPRIHFVPELLKSVESL